MSHLSEEQLILHYYSEEGDTLSAEQHLDQCEECRELYGSLQRVLNVVDSLAVPARGPEYGAAVWSRIENRLPARRRLWIPPAPWRWAAAAAVFASLMVVAFLAGRSYPKANQPAMQMGSLAEVKSGKQVLSLSVGDFLDRTQMVLVDLNNADPRTALDISAERERAADLVSEDRLFRQTALHYGDTAVASVLDDLERVLVDIAHLPSQMSPGDLERLRERLESQGILFKIRVLGTNVKKQGEPAGLVGQPSLRQKL